MAKGHSGKIVIKANLSDAVWKCLKQMDQYDERTSRGIREAIKRGTTNVYRRAISNVHDVPKPGRRTSKGLKQSIKMRFSDTEKTTAGVVYTNNPVAHLVERGAAMTVIVPVRKKALHPGGSGYFYKKATIPARPPHPFMQPAMDAERENIEEAVKEVLSKD